MNSALLILSLTCLLRIQMHMCRGQLAIEIRKLEEELHLEIRICELLVYVFYSGENKLEAHGGFNIECKRMNIELRPKEYKPSKFMAL